MIVPAADWILKHMGAGAVRKINGEKMEKKIAVNFEEVHRGLVSDKIKVIRESASMGGSQQIRIDVASNSVLSIDRASGGPGVAKGRIFESIHIHAHITLKSGFRRDSCIIATH